MYIDVSFSESGLVGLVGLVIFLSVMGIGISGISGISLVFEVKWLCDYAPARKRCRDILWEGHKTVLGALPAKHRIHLPWACVVWAHMSVAHACRSAMHDHV